MEIGVGSNGMGVVWVLLAQDTNKWSALRWREMVRGGRGRLLFGKDDTVLGSQEMPCPM